MKRIIIPALLVVFTLAAARASAQTRFIVTLKYKGSSPYTLSNPSAYLSPRSIERRARYKIALDSTDLPVSPTYLQQLANIPNVVVLNASRWLNQVSVQISDPNGTQAALSSINSLPFVQASAPIAARLAPTESAPGKKLEEDVTPYNARMAAVQENYYQYGGTEAQIHIHNGEFLHNMGLRGQSMIIGVVDAGFTNYLGISSLDSARTNGQILDTWDFVARNASVNEDHTHGTAVFSAIAANLPGQLVGSAPKANYFLFRSEDGASEYPIEEHNWVCAAERVDSAGGDVLTSSLGYNQFDDPRYNHTYADMNGNTTIAARGADIAVRKGLVVLNAAGNSGGDGWHYILTPADGDSVIAVGAVSRDSVVGGFSSYGPSSDGQVKPDVASVGVGTILQNAAGGIGWANGTSFATPNMSGLVTCLWQGFRELNNMKIANALRQSGHKAFAPDDRVGYGIPDMKKAVMILLKDFATSSATIANCRTTLTWTSKDVASMKYEIERKTPGDTAFTRISERFGTGATFANHTYTYTDTLNLIYAGDILYRVRQVIDTAAASIRGDYITTATAHLETPCVPQNFNPIVVTPNPVPQQFAVKVAILEAVPRLEIRISDVLGRTVAKMITSKQMGTATIPINNANLARGTYYVSVYNDGKLLGTQKLVKL